MNKAYDEFEERTGLRGKDFDILLAAVVLQCVRINIINKIFKIEKAGKGDKEKKIKKQVRKLLEKFKMDLEEESEEYHAALQQICLTPGVPYDATAGGKDADIFTDGDGKGANHRFATVGHDPVLGLLVGTANILTNTITYVERKSDEDDNWLKHLKWVMMKTRHVKYEVVASATKIDGVKTLFLNHKRPVIAGNASTIEMFRHVFKRADEEPEALVVAVVKQLAHLAMDLYTPAGIQLPGANLVLDKKTVEKLTRYISTGDVIKWSLSALSAAFINKVIAIIHGCCGIEEYGDAWNAEIYEVRTRKIVLVSNIIASSSNVLEMAVTKNVKSLDVGGMVVTLYRLFRDETFIQNLKDEFVTTKLHEYSNAQLGNDWIYYRD